MSDKLMDTEVGGEQTQYESQYTSETPHKKSGGQLGEIETTTDASKTEEGIEARKQRGEQTAENIRYGQTISEGGMSGFTTGQNGSGSEVDEQPSDGRRAAGYENEDGNGIGG